MNLQGVFIMYGSLSAIACAIVIGMLMKSGWGTALTAIGVVAYIVWVAVAFQIGKAMSSGM